MGSSPERCQIDLEYGFLPPDIKKLNVSMPTGRPQQAAVLTEQLLRNAQEEGVDSDFYFALYGSGSDKRVQQEFTLSPDTDTYAHPMYMMTGRTKKEAFQALSERLPQRITSDAERMAIVEYFCTGDQYAPQRETASLPFSGLSEKKPDFIEENGQFERIVGQLDDDLASGEVPILDSQKAEELGLQTGINWTGLIHNGHVTNEYVRWEKQDVFKPYTNVLGKKLREVGIRTHQRGINTQNDALGGTKGGSVPQSFREHVDERSPQILDPNARFVVAFGKKFWHPDYEAYYNLLTYAQSGQEIADSPLVAIPTGPSETVGIQTHDVNMDTAHQFRDWSSLVTDSLFYVMSHPRISDKFGTMSNIVNGRSVTGGVRAEMCGLIGPNGTLKQLSDAFTDGPFLAAQVTSTFDHRRLGGANGLRAPESIAAFSEMLGMQLAEIVRNNLSINTSEISMSLHQILPTMEIVSQEVVEGMFEKMLVVTQEIDKTIARLSQSSGNETLIDQMRSTKQSIQHRLRVDDGLQAFYMAIDGELREQYAFMSKVLDVRTHVLRAGADLRREGKFPIARAHNTKKTAQRIF